MRKAVPCLLSFVAAFVLSGAAARAAEADDARKEAAGGNYAKAIAAARAALAKAPDDLGTARLLQDLLVRVGKRDEAEKVGQEGASEETASYLRLRLGESKEAVEGFKKRRGAPGGPEWARLDLAVALLRGGNSAAAETEAKAYVKDHPQDVEGLLLLARVSATRQNMAAARAPLEQALQAEPGAAGPAVFLARLLQTLNEPAAARQVLVDALAVHSTHPELRLALALDQAVVGEALSADATLDALVQELPDWAPAHGAQAQVKRILGRLPEAEASARKAVELDPGEFAGQETLGFVLLKRKDLDGALEHYGAALRIDPTRIEPYVGLGYAQALRKEFKFAEDMLEKALKIDKDDVDANLKMGIVAYQKKDYRRAARHIQVVLRQDPQNLIAQRYMGYVLLNEGKAKEALDVLKKASIAAETEDAMTIRMMGRALFELGNKEEALTAFQRAVAVDEKDPWAHFDLGKAQEDGEEYPLAQASYEKAIELDATFSWPHLYLAELLDEVLDQKPEALAHYQRFLELSGPDPESDVKRRIDQLQKDVK